MTCVHACHTTCTLAPMAWVARVYHLNNPYAMLCVLQCCNASWSGARVLPGMATCVGYLNQRRSVLCGSVLAFAAAVNFGRMFCGTSVPLTILTLLLRGSSVCRSCMLVAMCVPRDVLIAALKRLERVAHISVSLTVPVTDDCADEKYQNQALSNTAFLTPDGPILLHKQPGQDTVPMPSHPDAAEAPSPDNRSLPLSFGCYHVPQSALVNKAACVPTNPMSKTRVGLSSPIGCAMDHNGSAITQPRTHHRSQPGAGNQVVRFSSISRY